MNPRNLTPRQCAALNALWAAPPILALLVGAVAAGLGARGVIAPALLGGLAWLAFYTAAAVAWWHLAPEPRPERAHAGD